MRPAAVIFTRAMPSSAVEDGSARNPIARLSPVSLRSRIRPLAWLPGRIGPLSSNGFGAAGEIATAPSWPAEIRSEAGSTPPWPPAGRAITIATATRLKPIATAMMRVSLSAKSEPVMRALRHREGPPKPRRPLPRSRASLHRPRYWLRASQVNVWALVVRPWAASGAALCRVAVIW